MADESDIYQRARAEAGDRSEATVAVDNYWAALDGGFMVAVDSSITPELAEEGLARELVHRVQNMRRSAILN